MCERERGSRGCYTAEAMLHSKCKEMRKIPASQGRRLRNKISEVSNIVSRVVQEAQNVEGRQGSHML